jgi:hypothetical protein
VRNDCALGGALDPLMPNSMRRGGIVNLSGRGMLVVSVARQLGSGNSFDRLRSSRAGPEKALWVR